MKKTTIPLRVIIPGLTLIFSILFGSILVLRELQDSEARMTQEMRRYAVARSTTIASMLQYLLRHNNHRGAELFISFTSSDINVQSVIVCNEKDQIIYSNRYALRNHPLKDALSPEILQQVKDAQTSLSTRTSEAQDKHLYSISSFLLPPSSGEIRPTAVGAVILDLDMEMIQAARRNNTYQKWSELAGLLLGFCGSIWIILHITLGKRVRRLATAADQIGEGKLDLKIKVCGRDEIAYLARTLENMAIDIKTNRDKLRKAYNEMEGRVKLRTADLENARRKAYDLMQDANIQREKAEKTLAQLNESQSELRTLSRAIEQSPAEVIITDTNNKITYVNPAFTQITGYNADEAIGQNPNFLNARVQPDKDYDKLWSSLLAGNQWCGEFCNKKKNGEIYWEMANISPVRDEQSNITHFVSVKEDVTAQKRVAEALTKAKQAAESANRAKSAFLANMSHEIRTPMNIIIGMSHLALDTDLSEKQQDYVQKISGASHSLLGIINDILDFSKIEAGKMTLESKPFKLDDVVNNVTGLLAVRLEEKKLELVIDIDRNIPLKLKGDSLRLTQVLNNLLSNAIKFTEKGEIILSAKVARTTGQNIELDFFVRDSGIGMSQEQLSKLFRSFTQADSSTTRKYGGTGLGLAICKQLCELMGGWIQAESTLEQGSLFHFHLPFKNIQTTQVRTSFNLTSDLKDMRVLVVDDNRAVRELINKFLTAMGFKSNCVSNGKSALLKIQKEEPYGLIILDWDMPEMNGIETGRNIRALNLPNPPKLLMLTAFGHDDVMYMAEKSGFSGFLLKPVHASALFNTIMHLFKEKDTHTQAETRNHQSHISGAHILLVEDHKINQQVAKELLEKTGMKVSIANNGQEALKLVTEQSFDLVLMDIQMPIMDGISASQEIRKLNLPHTQNLPILAMTAHAMSGDKERSLAAGMNGHITKPIDPDELFKAINHWLPSARITPFSKRTTTTETLPEIKGLDTAKALNRLNGNHILYQKLLARFIDETQDTNTRLNTAFQNSRPDEVLHIAHSIKGVAGNLGADKLHHHAHQLESALRTENKDPDKIATALQLFQHALQTSVASIRNYQSHCTITKENKPAGDLDALKKNIEDLQEPLKKQTPKPCQTIMNSIITKEWPEEINQQIQRLADLIARYQFSAAKEMLTEIQEKLKEPLSSKGEHHATE